MTEYSKPDQNPENTPDDGKVTPMKNGKKGKSKVPPVIQADTGTNTNTDSGNGNGAGRLPPQAPMPHVPARSAYNLDSLRLPADFSSVRTVVVLNKIPVRKPAKPWFNRSHPTFVYRAYTLEWEPTRETYLVFPDVAEEISEDVVTKEMRLAVNREGLLFFWIYRVPDDEGRIDDWNDTSREGCDKAIHEWIGLKSYPAGNRNNIVVAKAGTTWPEPDWDKLTQGKSFEELVLDIAFKNRVIDSVDHPIALKARGLK